ncbi:MFS-type transporter MFS54-like protein [Cladobotryum mycophilum]|uniref:MFS-type transporter MFS54-like protein n=1 Tax=Cladobotryum mycophilum TaxID=491253 RepID=A0ABR0SHD0_9HYPO
MGDAQQQSITYAPPMMDTAQHHGDLSPIVAESTRSPPSPSTVNAKTNNVITVSTTRFWLLSIGVYIGLFLAMMDASIVSSSLHTIASDFNVFVSVNWVALAYTLAECSCSIVFARVSDVIGRRNAFLIAMTLFFAFSLACGFAHSLHQLVAFRTIQGIGGAGLYSLSTVLLPEVCPDHLLEYMAGLAGVVIIAACIVGPIVGGLLTQYASWRWIFWINGPICVVATVFVLVFWPKQEQIMYVRRRSWREFDYLGSTLLIAATILVVFSFQNVGVSTTKDTWGKAVFIAPVVIGFVSWAALFSWEYLIEFRGVGNSIMPTFPLSLFKNRFYAAGIFTTLFLGFPVFVLVFSVPLRCQLVSGKSPLTAALMLLPMLGATAMGCVLAAAFNAKRNFLFESMLAGAVMSLIGCSLLTTISGSEDDHKMMGYLVFAGIGSGLTIASATGVTGIEIAPRNYAPAQGILAQARVLGGSFGISTSSVFLHNEILRLVPGPVSPELLSTLSDAQSKLPPQLQAVVKLGTAQSFRNSMIVCASVAGVAVVLSFVGFQLEHKDSKQQRIDMIRADAQAVRDDEKRGSSVRVSEA